MTKEGKVKAKLKDFLTHIGAWQYWPVSNGMGAHGIPDVIGCHDGRFFAIEVKAPGRRGEKNRGASPLQVLQIEKIQVAKGIALVFDGEPDDIERLMFELDVPLHEYKW